MTSLVSPLRASALAVLMVAGVLTSANTASAAARPVIGAYYAGWNSQNYPVSQIPADRLTHLFYAFSTIENGKCVAGAGAPADFAALARLKKAKPHLKTLISIGGWGAGGFSDAALTPASRAAFVKSCVDMFFVQYRGSFDGVDIDWEFPVYGGPAEITDRPQDKRNMTLLTKEFRRQLGPGKLVTGALPTGRLQTDGPYDPALSFELGELAKVMDFINVMTYDMGTGFSAVSTFNAPMKEVADDPLGQPMRRWNNVTAAIEYYKRHGVPGTKMVLGVPFYGRGFIVNEPGTQNGLYQSYGSAFWPGGWGTIKQDLLPDQAWTQFWHPVAQAPWLYNAAERKFLSYENPRSIGIKAQFAKKAGLIGTFMWELSDDDSSHSLLKAMSGPFVK
ncbi:glycoside hydrolase family 18 protein [Kibdelosporangium aridum]|uniref:chitinase n=1 Tax=Kibdelosporangium aridum TaxID=2030 RepID=A0A1W2F394_KIBAR|nr:glycoside hydrolase family 18 protein [Kibdelosporangium aridum]SMD16387.1 chitinase [Kibdelosporangium aridum]